MAANNSLAPILAGRTRRAILTRLYRQPGDSMWLRQLARETGFGIGPVQRALAALMAARVIRRRARGNRVYFQANSASPLYSELRRELAPKARKSRARSGAVIHED